LAEQWQDELYQRFQLPFDILTNDKLEAARTGNWFVENKLVIARLDKLSRDENFRKSSKRPIVAGISSFATKPTRCPPLSSAEKSNTQSATDLVRCFRR
jgi:hypothetical protein